MIKRQTIEMPNRLSTMYIVHNFNRPLAERLRSRKNVGPYNCTRRDSSADSIGMYMGSGMCMGDGPLSLRLEWAHDVEGVSHRNISRGWYTDDFQTVVCGIVARLPRSRGFLAGYAYGENMTMCIETEVYDCEVSAAYAADSIAERHAEGERLHQYLSDIEQDIELLREDIRIGRKRYASLATEYREARKLSDQFPVLCRTIQDKLAATRSHVSDSLRDIKEKQEEIAMY